MVMHISFTVNGKRMSARGIVNENKRRFMMFLMNGKTLKKQSQQMMKLLRSKKINDPKSIKKSLAVMNCRLVSIVNGLDYLSIIMNMHIDNFIDTIKRIDKTGTKYMVLVDEIMSIKGDDVVEMLNICKEALMDMSTMINTELILANFTKIQISQMMKEMDMPF